MISPADYRDQNANYPIASYLDSGDDFDDYPPPSSSSSATYDRRLYEGSNFDNRSRQYSNSLPPPGLNSNDYKSQPQHQHQHQQQQQQTNLNAADSCDSMNPNSVIPVPRRYDVSRPIGRIEDEHSHQLVSALMEAASSNQIKIVYDIINNGFVLPDAQDRKFNTAMLYAAINGHLNIVRKLIDLGANANYCHPYTRNTALHLAAQCGHTRTVEMLLKIGAADARLVNAEGKTAFQLAKDFGHGNNKVMKRVFKEIEPGFVHQQYQNQPHHHRHQPNQYQNYQSAPYRSNGASRSTVNNRDASQQSNATIGCYSGAAAAGQYASRSSIDDESYHSDRSSMSNEIGSPSDTEMEPAIEFAANRGSSKRANGSSRPNLLITSSSSSSSLGRDRTPSLFPNQDLLTLMGQTGVFRPLPSGKGFAFLAPYGEPNAMIDYARVSLQIDSDSSLLEHLITITRDYDEDCLMKNHESYCHSMRSGEKAADCVGNNNSSTFQNSKRRQNGNNNSKNSDYQHVDESYKELENYRKWKQFNIYKIQEMISTLNRRQSSSTLSGEIVSDQSD